MYTHLNILTAKDNYVHDIMQIFLNFLKKHMLFLNTLFALLPIEMNLCVKIIEMIRKSVE